MSELLKIEGIIRRIADHKNIEEYFAYHDLLIDEFKSLAARAEAAEAKVERLVKLGDTLAEYVDLLARRLNDVTTSELEGAVHAYTEWVMRGEG